MKALDATVACIKDMHEWGLGESDWSRLQIINSILQYFSQATSQLDAQKFITLFATVPIYNFLIDKLEDKVEDQNITTIEKIAIEAAIKKLKKYYSLTGTSVYLISTSK